VKLILVGRGGAGKTSTVRALQGEPFDTHEKSTPGIALCDLPLKDCKGGPVTAHVWDFAGQVITHALHQFFFSVRSVYVLVLSGRENHEREDAEYWLRLIRAFGTDEAGKGPPVIVVLNQWDVPGCRPKVDRLALQERYPFVAAFVEMDCQTRKGVANLKKTLSKEVDKLKWIREPFQPEWAAVRKALTAAGKKQRAHLSYTEYRALCTTHGVTAAGEQDSLSEILHNLGAALNYRNDPRLREATVLQPLWLTKNVYGLVRQAEKQSGVLKQADVDAVLAKEKDVKMREYLVQIMERFEIAYIPRSSSGGMWLVPQALPIGQPKGVESFAKEPEATHLRYTYEALPEGLVARAIVRLHEFIEEANGKPQQWASGAVLTREGARALLRAETPLQVMITVTGPAKARQQLAGLCQAEMRDINAEIRGLNPLEETKVQGAWVSIATLELDERNKRPTGVSVPTQGTVMIDPKGANDEYSTPPARQKEIWKPAVFISYSKDNLAQRKRLESELKILHNGLASFMQTRKAG
jgi:internalin A